MRLYELTSWIRWAIAGAVSLAIACGLGLVLRIIYSHVAKPMEVAFARGPHSLFAEETGFFPEGALLESVDEWYSKMLLAMGEPPLRATPKGFAYRLIFLSASADYVSIRVEASAEKIWLHIKTLRSVSLIPSEFIDARLANAEITDRTISVSPFRWRLVESLIYSSGFLS